MIRRWLHKRWTQDAKPEDRLLRSFRCLKDTWIDRYNERHVERYGDQGLGEPWWHKPITAFVLWLYDWQTTLQMRKPMTSEEWRSLMKRPVDSQ